MFGNIQKYMKAKYGNLPTRKVTKDELIRIIMEKEGKSEEDAKFAVEFGLKLGSDSVVIGDENFEIINETN